MNGLTDVPGILVGHASDYEGLTGCTAILCPGGAVAGVDVRGSATGTEELDLLNPLHLTTQIHGVCFAGGSAFGLEAASGVRRHLEKQGIGFVTQHAKIPLVAGAILYDLGIGSSAVRPGREMGEAAARGAGGGPVAEGSVGAGTGATVGKVLGMQQAMKGGIGSYSITLPGGAVVAALAAVNAYGDVIHAQSGAVIAGVRTGPESRAFARASELLKKRLPQPAKPFGNTTLVVVATNARLSKPQAAKLAQLAQHGMVRTISPVHTVYDGDIVFALSTGSVEADFTALGLAAADAVAESIMRSVLSAWTLGGVPGLAPRGVQSPAVRKR